MKLKEFKEKNLKCDTYYLIQNNEWSPSGYAIARYDGKELICEACGRAIPFEDILGIIELD